MIKQGGERGITLVSIFTHDEDALSCACICIMRVRPVMRMHFWLHAYPCHPLRMCSRVYALTLPG